MKKKNQKEAKKPETDRLTQLIESNLLAQYINLSLQGLIAFGIAVIFGGIMRIIWKDIPLWLLFPLTFVFMIVFSVLFSKRLSKIQVGFKIQKWYVGMLKKIVEK